MSSAHSYLQLQVLSGCVGDTAAKIKSLDSVSINVLNDGCIPGSQHTHADRQALPVQCLHTTSV